MKRKISIVMLWVFMLSSALFVRGGTNLEDNPSNPIWKFSPTLGVETEYINWAKPLNGTPLTATIIAPTWAYRDVVELCKRMPLKVNSIQTLSFFVTVSKSHFFTYPDLHTLPEVWLKLIDRELAKPADVIVIGKMKWDALAENARKEIIQKVRNGCGLVYINPEFEREKDGKVNMLLGKDAKVPLTLFESSEYIASMDLKGLPQLLDNGFKDISYKGQLGKGRVFVSDFSFIVGKPNLSRKTPEQWNKFWKDITYGNGQTDTDFLGSMDVRHSLVGAAFANEMPCAYEYLMSYIIKAVLWASGREPAAKIEGISLAENKITVKKPGADKVTLELRDAKGTTGNIIKSWEDAGDGVEVPELSGGTYFINAWLKDDDGNIIDWNSKKLDIKKTAKDQKLFKSIELDEPAPRLCQPLEGNINFLTPCENDEKIRLTVTDNFSRILWQKEITAPLSSKSLPFEINVSPGRSVAVILKAELVKDGSVTDEIEKLICFSTMRLDGDFASVVWSHISYHAGEDRVFMQDMKLMANLGLDAAQHVPDHMKEHYIKSNIRLISQLFRVTRHGMKGFAPYSIAFHKQLVRDKTAKLAPYAPLALTLGDETYFGFDSVWSDGGGITAYLDQPSNNQNFRLFLGKLTQGTYTNANIAKINKIWGTDYKDVKDIELLDVDVLRKQKRRAQFVTQALWGQWRFQEIFREMIESGKMEIPDAYYGDEGRGNIHSSGGHDYYTMEEDLTVSQVYEKTDFCSQAFVMSFERKNKSSLRGMWNGFYGYFNGPCDKEWMTSIPWRYLFYGMNSTWWWMDIEGIRCDAKPTEAFAAVQRETSKIKKGPATLILKASSRTLPQVAVLYSPNTIHANTFDYKESGPHKTSLSVSSWGMFYTGYSFRVIHPSQLNDAKELATYKALILPAIRCLSKQQVKNIKKFVFDGGLLLADRTPDTFLNEYGVEYEKNPFLEILQKHNGENEYSYGKGTAVFLKDSFALLPLQRYKDTFGQTYCEKKKLSLPEMFRGFIEKATGCRPPVTFRTKDGKILDHSEINTFASAGAMYIGIDRNGRYWEGEERRWPTWDDYKENIETTLELPRELHFYDITKGKYIGYGKNLNIKLDSEPRLFAALPAKITGIDVAGIKDSYQRGDTLEASLEIKKDGNEVFPSVVHVSVKHEDRELACFDRNIVLSFGKASFEIPFALNEAPGKYEIEFKDTASGVKSVKSFSIK